MCTGAGHLTCVAAGAAHETESNSANDALALG